MASTLRTLLQRQAASPDDAPMGMPGRFYTCPQQFAQECETILADGWHCVGRVDEIPEPGDWFTVQLLNEPLLIVRAPDNEVRVFANLCRHRGMPLAEGTGHSKRFVCPYHAWTYGLDGRLLRATRFEHAGFDASSCALHCHNTRIWRGFIYVSLKANAAWPEMPGLDTLLTPYETERFRLVHRAEEIWQTNWKCLVENFMEGYHLSVVHPTTLHGYTPTGLSQKLPSGEGFTAYAANYPGDIPSRGLGAPGLTEAERQRSTLFARFPTQVASQAASLLVSLSLFPRAPDAVHVKWTMSVYGDDLDEATIDHRIALWEEVNREDREKLERMQKGLASQHAEAGPLAAADLEGTIRDFHQWLAMVDRTYP